MIMDAIGLIIVNWFDLDWDIFAFTEGSWIGCVIIRVNTRIELRMNGRHPWNDDEILLSLNRKCLTDLDSV